MQRGCLNNYLAFSNFMFKSTPWLLLSPLVYIFRQICFHKYSLFFSSWRKKCFLCPPAKVRMWKNDQNWKELFGPLSLFHQLLTLELPEGFVIAKLCDFRRCSSLFWREGNLKKAAMMIFRQLSSSRVLRGGSGSLMRLESIILNCLSAACFVSCNVNDIGLRV